MRSQTKLRRSWMTPAWFFRLATVAVTSLVCAACATPSQQAALDLANVEAAGQFRPMRVESGDFAGGTDLHAIEKATPVAGGSRILRDKMLTDDSVNEAVERNGLPNGVELESPQDFAMFYRDRPRTIVSQTPAAGAFFSNFRSRGELVTVDYVPYSVRRMTFGEAATAQPWPVTITSNDLIPFAMPSAAAPPSTDDLNGKAYANYTAGLSGKYPAVTAGGDVQRVTRIFAALAEVAQAPGIQWKLVIFDSPAVKGFGEPDGTIFISNALVLRFTDAELTAAIAHIMAHERYGHDIFAWKRWNAAQKTLAVSGSVIGDLALTLLARQAVVLPLPGTTKVQDPRMREIEANNLAAQYLQALHVPPSALFDALLESSVAFGNDEPSRAAIVNSKVDSPPAYPDDFPPDFADPLRDRQSAADLGKLLDAGIIPSASTASLQAAASDVPTVSHASQANSATPLDKNPAAH